MAQITTVRCDNCNEIKREVNHWWKGFVSARDNTTIMILPHAKEPVTNTLVQVDLCGFDCVTKWLHQQMQEIINRENANRTAGTDKDKV